MKREVEWGCFLVMIVMNSVLQPEFDVEEGLWRIILMMRLRGWFLHISSCDELKSSIPTSHCGLGERCEDGGNCLASSLTVCLRVCGREWSAMMITEGEKEV